MRKFFSVLVVFLVIIIPIICLPDRGIDINFDNRLALVIGNGHYKNAPLKNPVNDANDIANLLTELGFKVNLKVNANQRTMEESIRDFGKGLQKGGIGLFYFAGHGIQFRGRNYLLPVNARIESEADVKYETVDVGRVLAQMEEAGNNFNIIILDACRNNPFARSFRSSGMGLAKMDAPMGSFLAYSTAPGNVAADGDGRNGLYTSKLLKYIAVPGMEIGSLFRNVRAEVVAETNMKQVPWESSSLIGTFYFKKAKDTAQPDVKALQQVKVSDKSQYELLFWESIKESKDPEMFRAYLEKYPNGAFSVLAELELKKYSQKIVAISPADKNYTKDRPYRLAIFPWKLYGRAVSAERALDPLVEFIKKEQDFELTFNAVNPENIRKYEKMLNDIYSDGNWDIKHLMPSGIPDTKNFCKIGRKLNMDVILIGSYSENQWGNITNPGIDDLQVYMIDISTEKLFSVRNLEPMTYFIFNYEYSEMLRELFQKYKTEIFKSN